MDQIETKKLPKILIVDDDLELTRLVKHLLHRAGFRVSTATNSIEALKEIWHIQPDLILLDIMLPGMNGIEFCRQLKNEFDIDIPVIFVSSLDEEFDALVGFEVGAVDYIKKPLNIKEMIARCKSVLATKYSQEAFSIIQKENKRLRHQKQELLSCIDKLEKQNQPEKNQEISLSSLIPLISGIVHDLRGGLGVIRNTAGFALDEINETNALVPDLQKIIQSTKFCEVIVRNLMAIGGEATFEPTEVNIEQTVRDVFFMLERKLVDIKLVVNTDDSDIPAIMADEGQIQQVFMNLFKNATEAMADGGTLTIRIQHQDGRLRVEVSDMESGISAENIERIFDLYFTTKTKGFGIGLHIVRDIVERHGGTIEVASEINQGTTFTLDLPI